MPAPWQDPELVARGREPMHAVRREPGLLLDGTWRFQLLPRPDAPIGADWRDIAVPGCWTMQDTADLPQYTNVQMPFAGEPPHVPEANPTGVYERDVEIPAEWAGQRVVLHVGAAESVVIVEVNGRRVGVGKDSHLASEFDVSGHLAAGRNTLRLTVVKWSDATFIEDQDQWWHGGLTRSVYLYATPPVFLGDVAVTAELAEAGAADTTGPTATTGRLAVEVQVGGLRGDPAPGWRVEARLEGVAEVLTADLASFELPHWATDPAGRALIRRHELYGATGMGEDEGRWRELQPHLQPARTGSARLAVEVPAVQAWSAEIPRLYGLEVRLLAADGSVVDRAQVRIGFRSVEVRGTDLLVNGRRVLIQGVNRHDFDQHTGRVISPEAMRRDLLAMKRHGVNAVRTSHYPNDPAFLDLTDELGLYVIDEADIESHALQASLCDDPRYLAQWVSRVSRMVLRDRNHASVIAWSLGNESGFGTNHEAAAAWLRRHDPSRPLHYEGAIRFDWAGGASASDIVCPMYPAISAIVEFATSGRLDRPLIMCEYSHAMGNSNGTLAEYWDAIESTPGLQGGFIWEWWDHGLVQILSDGRTRWAYGGDFGDVPNDGNFCADGLNWPDGRPKPAMREVAFLFSPARVVAGTGDGQVPDGHVRVADRQSFRDLGWLRGRWELIGTDGAVAASGPLASLAGIGPGDEAEVALEGWQGLAAGSGAGAMASDAGARWLTIRFETAADEPWAAAGTEVGWGQLALAGGSDGPGASAASTPMTAEGGSPIELDADGYLIHPLLTAGPRLSLWRAPTDNDRFGGLAARWQSAGLADLRPGPASIEREGASVIVHREVEVGARRVAHRQTFTPLPDGGIQVAEEAVIPPGLDDLPRVGTVLELIPGLEQVEWFGIGPHETYPDRKRSGLVGRWRSTVGGLFTPYIRPQEAGGRADVRWIELRDEAGAGARLTMGAPMQVSATHHRASDLASATHAEDLVPRPEVVVHLDAAHRGLGTASCGPDTTEPYLLGPGTYRWEWTLQNV